MIAFYYALSGFACAIYYRHELFKTVKNFVFIGAAPVLGFDGSPSARVALSVGEGPFKSAILGSTPHKLLHVSEVPVLCVPAESAGSL